MSYAPTAILEAVGRKKGPAIRWAFRISHSAFVPSSMYPSPGGVLIWNLGLLAIYGVFCFFLIAPPRPFGDSIFRMSRTVRVGRVWQAKHFPRRENRNDHPNIPKFTPIEDTEGLILNEAGQAQGIFQVFEAIGKGFK